MKARMFVWGAGLTLVSMVCSAQVPAMINYQGRLIDGTNLYNGQVGLSLQLWSAMTGGLKLGEDSNTVTVVDGLYSALLGDDMPDGALAQILNDNTNLYIQVLVNGSALAPRERLASTAYAVIPGIKGVGNVQAGARSAVGGGETNIVYAAASVIGGGRANVIGTSAWESVIGGGGRNQVEPAAIDSVIGGGTGNRIAYQAYYSAVGGGADNTVATQAYYSAIGGGGQNEVGNYSQYATIPGGRDNEANDNYAFAAGRRAKADHQGSFVWADSTDADFGSTANNQFLIRAAGGVGIGTNVPTARLTVAGDVRASEVIYGESFVGDGSGVTSLNGQNITAGTISNAQLGVGIVRGTNLAAGSVGPDKLTESYWKITGNNNVTAGTHFVGTTTTNPLEIKVWSARVMRFENFFARSPNLIGGHNANTVTLGLDGCTIAGGGSLTWPNRILDDYGSIGGGAANTAGDGAGQEYATVGGGYSNEAVGAWSTVPGGAKNRASEAYAFAAGRRAKAIHGGAFVWADSTDADFSSTASDQFIVRASGGVGLNESNPRQQLSVGNYLDLYSGAANFPAQTSIRASTLGHLFLNARSGGNVYVNYDAGDDLIINPNGGRVGIHTNTPSATLTVDGDARITEVVYAESFVGDGSGLIGLDGANIQAGTVTTDQLAEAYWRLDGNANVVTGVHFIGTTSPNTPVELRASNTRVLLLDGVGEKLIGGSRYNCATGGASGVTIGGGGQFTLPNRVSDSYGTVGGGQGNLAGNGNTNAGDTPDATVSGGKANEASGVAASVGGGRYNEASGTNSTVAGGNHNVASGANSTIGGGTNNLASGEFATVGGGESNRASSAGSVIAGGARNSIDSLSPYAAVGGGRYHAVDTYATNAVIGGGEENTITSATRGTIGGGWRNRIDHGSYSFVGGGTSNMTAGAHSAIAGGLGNVITINARQAAIGGGFRNSVNANAGFIGGGSNNAVHVRSSSIVGGENNMASGEVAVVCGGLQNDVRGFGAFIGSGQNNSATGDLSTVSGGMDNDADGTYATVPGGRDNVADGRYSLAAGRRSKAGHNGTFLWGDSTDADLVSTATDQFMVRAKGGSIFYSDAAMSAGVQLAAGAGAWTSVSDRDAKEDFREVDGREILDRLSAVPITTWKYKAQDAAIRHIGPVAQDFHVAFGVGETPTGITTV
ncbi:MAG: tail fiber domain-containing protein, partial [Verrucomicrobia bacterium]|nr:tail fiber domain-containing protein [Verrucomicrobiota bacterium]